MPHNDRGYGLGRAAGGFPVSIATKGNDFKIMVDKQSILDTLNQVE